MSDRPTEVHAIFIETSDQYGTVEPVAFFSSAEFARVTHAQIGYVRSYVKSFVLDPSVEDVSRLVRHRVGLRR